MHITAEITVTQKVRRHFFLFHMRHLFLTLLITELLLLAFFIAAVVALPDKITSDMGLLLALPIFVGVLLFAMSFRQSKLTLIQRQVFCDDSFSTEVADSKIESRFTMKYQDLYRVCESKAYLYLYLDREQVIIVDKSKVSAVALTELKQALKQAPRAKMMRER